MFFLLMTLLLMMRIIPLTILIIKFKEPVTKIFFSKNKYNKVLIDSRYFYDQPIGDQVEKYDVIRKIITRQGTRR